MNLSERIDRYDQGQYLELLDGFPDQVASAWEVGESFDLPEFECDDILVCGMGGSGITGDLLDTFTRDSSTVPVATLRDYQIPRWVDGRTLLILVSYSGETEETLTAYRSGHRRAGQCLAVTSNGTLEKEARANDHPIVSVPAELPPRASAGYLLIPLLRALGRWGLSEGLEKADLEECRRNLTEMTRELSPQNPENHALSMAQRLRGTIPVIYGNERTTGVLARRLKNQLNENAKMFAHWGTIPEVNHNEIMAWESMGGQEEPFQFVFLRDAEENPRVQHRFDISRRMIEQQGMNVLELDTRGQSRLSRYFTLMVHCDYLSYYLALHRAVDPSSIEAIETFKRQV